jgi:aminoglycoside phosphotransferase (APT) family kinase protein
LGGAVISAQSQSGGFSPGVAARIRTSDGRRVFAKAAGPEPNARAPEFHRREAAITAALPSVIPAPRLLWSYDEGDGGWVVLVFEEIDGRPPVVPWQSADLDRVLDALVGLSELLTPSPLPPATVGSAENWGVVTGEWWRRLRNGPPAELEPWSLRHLDALATLEERTAGAVAGETLLHLDLRADNLLLTPGRVLVVDWPHARIGAAWLDLVLMAPSVTMQGGPEPEVLLARHPAARIADPAAITAALAAIAGCLTWGALQPPPPGLPTLPAFQAAQASVARRWLARRTGWT